MVTYISKRLFMALVTIYIVVTLSFFMVRLMPGNAMQYLTSQLELQGGYTPQEIQQKIQAIYGLLPTNPLWQQYFTYVGHAFQGNFGTSLLNPGETVIKIVADALPWTLFTVGSATLIGFVLGCLVGMFMAHLRTSKVSKLLTFAASFLSAVPNYLIAIVLIYFVALKAEWLPESGNYGLGATPGFNWPFIASVLEHAILPISAYVLTAVGGWALGMKGAAVSTLGSEYVRAAEARGLESRRVATSYVGRNSMLPQVTGLALAIGGLFGGSVFIETYFIYPGIGYYLIQAVSARDYSLMMGCFLLVTVAVVLCNLFVDLLYPLIDPRIVRAGGPKRARTKVVAEPAHPVLPAGGTAS